LEGSFLRKNVSSFSSASFWALSLADFIISIKLWFFCPVVLFIQFHRYNTNINKIKKTRKEERRINIEVQAERD